MMRSYCCNTNFRITYLLNYGGETCSYHRLCLFITPCIII